MPEKGGPVSVTVTDASAARLAAAEAAFTKEGAKVEDLRSKLAKAEASRAAAEEELNAARLAHEAAIAAAEEKARLAKRWHPPCDAASRQKALGEDPTTALSLCWDTSEPLPLPRPEDWLGKNQPGEADRPGQTVAQFCRPGRSVPSPMVRTIYLMPLGRSTGAPPSKCLVDFVRASFGIDVRLLPASTVTERETAGMKRGAGADGRWLLSSNDALDILYRHKPKDAFLLIAYTMEELAALESFRGGVAAAAPAAAPAPASEAPAETNEEDSHVKAPPGFEMAAANRKAAKQASAATSAAAGASSVPPPPKLPVPTYSEVQPLRGVAVISFGSFADADALVDIDDAVAFSYICRSVATHATYLHRASGVLGNAVGRLLGMATCVYGRCLMNGALHLGELDSRPLLLCPLELKKLATTLEDAARVGALPPMHFEARLAQRERAVLQYLEDYGFLDEAARCQRRLERLEKVVEEESASRRHAEFEHENEMAREIERAREAVRAQAAESAELRRLEEAAALAKASSPTRGGRATITRSLGSTSADVMQAYGGGSAAAAAGSSAFAPPSAAASVGGRVPLRGATPPPLRPVTAPFASSGGAASSRRGSASPRGERPGGVLPASLARAPSPRSAGRAAAELKAGGGGGANRASIGSHSARAASARG